MSTKSVTGKANFRRVLIVIIMLFIIGAFICAFFMQEAYSYYNGYLHYEINEFGPTVISLSSTLFLLVIPEFVFSNFFKHKGLYVPSVVINIFMMPLLICDIVFSAISIDRMSMDEAASIVSTVFVSVDLFFSLMALVLGLVILKRIKRPAKENNEVRDYRAAPKEEEFSMSTVYDDLKKAKDLLDCGAITQEEYDNIKKRILKQ
ncbi:MAG: SHOCT domain-containing protein [Bacilli bacterium]|nr:SHOCT domain-containing protein [Bacilli bacterium]